MSRATDRNRFQRDAERRFPIKVDIPVPPLGMGGRLNQMHDWCHNHVTAGTWEEHAHSDERRDSRGIRIDFARCEKVAERYAAELPAVPKPPPGPR